MKIKIGCDPEIFVKDGRGSPRCAFNMIPGSKAEPYRVDNGAVQPDGFAAEFNIDPCDTVEEWLERIESVMGTMEKMLPKRHVFAIVPSVKFTAHHFGLQSEEAKELGCTPDYNAYTLEENPRPDNATTMRTASGHVHIGFCEDADVTDPAHIQRCATLVKQLDCYLGLSSLKWDKDTKRRSMYGKAGAFRPKPYGVEYRVLSNAWLLTKERQKFVFETTKLAVDKLIEGERPFTSPVFNSFSDINSRVLQRHINNSEDYYANTRIREGRVPGLDWNSIPN